MPNPTHIERVSTTTFVTHMDDKSRVYTVRGPHNPIYTETPDGKLHDLDPAKMVDHVSEKAGPLKIKDRVGPYTVGHRQDGRKSKYLGLRPSTIQDGSIQLEFSLLNVDIDGPKDTKLNDQRVHDNITYDFGDVLVRSTRQGVRQMVKAVGPITDFVVNYEIHTTGLSWVYKEELDEYWFYDLDGKFRYRIVEPKLLDENLEPIYFEDKETGQRHALVKHWLKEIDGKLIYTKVPSEHYADNKPQGNFYIDVDIVFSSTADGYVGLFNGDWTTARNGATGGFANSSSSSYLFGMAARTSYIISRCFWYFDTSSVVGTITAVDLMIFGSDNDDSSAIAQEGTQAATLTTDDYDSFTGAPNGTSFGSSGAWSIISYNTISYNPSGIASINQSGETLVCTREETKDFANVVPVSATSNGAVFADNADTDEDPKFEITVGAPPAGIEVDATTDALTLTEHGAGVNAKISIEATRETLSLAEFNPNINAEINIGTTLEQLTLTEHDASVNAEIDVLATKETLTLTEFNVGVNAEIIILANSEALSLAEHDVSLNIGIGIDATSETLTLIEHNADVKADININASSEPLTLSENNANINAEVDILATLESLTLTEFNATVTVGVDIEVSATSESLTLAEFNAVINAETNVSATSETLTLVEYNAEVKADINIEATKESLTLAEHNAGINIVINISTTSETLTLAEFKASVNAEINVNTTLAQLSLAEYSANVLTAIADASIFRTLDIVAESRVLNIIDESRILGIIAENRKIDIITENRELMI